MLFGWCLTILSAVGNGLNDVAKKYLLNRGLDSWESISLLSSYGAILNFAWCLVFFDYPVSFQEVFWPAFYSSIGKLFAPLSTVVPFLAWNPVFLLIVGFFFLNETPSVLGVVGCLVVVVGAYLSSIDYKLKTAAKNKKQDELDAENNVKIKKKGIMDTILSFKGGLYMMGVSLLWTFTSALEKYTLKYSSYIPIAYMLGMQRFFMAVPSLLISIHNRPKYIDNSVSAFWGLLLGSLNESMQILTYFVAIRYIFVSYVIAIKRAGNIFLSLVIGRIVYKEQLTLLLVLSASCMILGVILIVLG